MHAKKDRREGNPGLSEETEEAAARIREQIGSEFPLAAREILIGSRAWQITAVQDPDALLDHADAMEHFPFGFMLWESAVGLAEHLNENPGIVAGRRVLELGAGVGLVGIVAASLGAQVWMTDHQPGALALAGVNAWDNGVRDIHRLLADWRTWNYRARYDVILGSDILYSRDMHYYLGSIFRRTLAPGGRLLLSDPGRPQAMEFASSLETSGWKLTLQTRTVVRLDKEAGMNEAGMNEAGMNEAGTAYAEIAILTAER